jgi:flagellar hook-basal body protein
VSQQFTQGNIEATSNNLDLAISGQGFFVLSDAGAMAYTRAGAFQTDNSGYVVNTEGQRLQVYPVTAGGGFNTATLSDLRLVTSDSAPAATVNAELVYNLPADAAQPATATFDPTDTSSYNNSSSLTVYDSLGAAHTASLLREGHGDSGRLPRRRRDRQAARRWTFVDRALARRQLDLLSTYRRWAPIRPLRASAAAQFSDA